MQEGHTMTPNEERAKALVDEATNALHQAQLNNAEADIRLAEAQARLSETILKSKEV